MRLIPRNIRRHLSSMKCPFSRPQTSPSLTLSWTTTATSRWDSRGQMRARRRSYANGRFSSMRANYFASSPREPGGDGGSCCRQRARSATRLRARSSNQSYVCTSRLFVSARSRRRASNSPLTSVHRPMMIHAGMLRLMSLRPSPLSAWGLLAYN